MRRLYSILPLVLSVAGCIGGITNDPFTAVGTLTGRVEGAEAGVYVLPVGQPDLATRTDELGTFTLEDLPAGPIVLVATDTLAAAARVEVLVVAGVSAVSR